MKNNKFTKATSIVMSAVVAGMVMGSGTCSAESTKLDKAKEFFRGLTKSRIFKDISDRNVSIFAAGFCAAAAVVSGVAYYGHPNGLADLAKRVVETDSKKLLALHLKDYKFEDETADAFLLISAESKKEEERMKGEEKAKKEGMEDKEGAEKPKVKARANVVCKATSDSESAFKKLMGEYAEGKTHGKLKFVTIDASHLFGAPRRIDGNKLDEDYARGLISSIEDSAKLSGSWLGIFGHGSAESGNNGAGKEEKKEKSIVISAFAVDEIKTGVKGKVNVKLSQAEGAKVLSLELAGNVEGDIGAKREVRVKANVTEFVRNEDGTCDFTLDGQKFEKVTLVKEGK